MASTSPSAIPKGTKTHHKCAHGLRIDSYDRFQQTYEVKNILTDLKFDQKKYNAYSPIYLSTTFALQYGLSFAAIVATVFHVGLWHGEEIVARTKGASTRVEGHSRKAIRQVSPSAIVVVHYAMFVVFVGIGMLQRVPSLDCSNDAVGLAVTVLAYPLMSCQSGLISSLY